MLIPCAIVNRREEREVGGSSEDLRYGNVRDEAWLWGLPNYCTLIHTGTWKMETLAIERLLRAIASRFSNSSSCKESGPS